MVTETPHWQFGGRANFEFGAFEFGIQGKKVGSRFATDTNDVKVKGYTVWDLDARYDLRELGLEKTFVQFNVTNLFDEHYFGNISTQINNAGGPNFAVGSPRTIMGTLNVGF
jgi:iron complex outermembrane receptor protein